MSPTEAKARETREWLAKSLEDAESAEVLLAAGKLGNALFFCQQSVEKSLKGFLTWHELPFRKTHDLEELSGHCIALDNTLTSVLGRADLLTDYAWKLRYPGFHYEPEAEEVHGMIGLARSVFESMRSRLPVDAPTGSGQQAN